MKRYIIPIVSTLILSAALTGVFLTVPLLPPLAAEQGQPVDTMLRLLFVLASVVFSLVISFLLYSVIVFRRRAGDSSDGPPLHGSAALEVAWTLVPLAIVISLGVFGAQGVVYLHQPAGPQDLVVEVIGQQWNWTFNYPGLGISSSPELVLPVDRPALLQLHSLDVNHSFWVPEFRIKVDALPGLMTHARLTPTVIGEYKARCAELCGTAHAYMSSPVRVVDEASFQAWVQKQQSSAPPGQQGQAVALQAGCLSCHSTDGHVMVAPTYKGLYGSQVRLQDGTTVTADDAYIRNSILTPGAQIVQGFSDIMPHDFGTRLTAAQIAALIEFIRSLK